MRVNIPRISPIALKVTPGTMISKVRRRVKGAVIRKVQNKLWGKYLHRSNKLAKRQSRRSRARCLRLIGSSIYRAISSSIGRASTVNSLEDQEQVTSSTERERSLSATVPSRRRRGRDSSAKSCANSRTSKMNAKE